VSGLSYNNGRPSQLIIIIIIIIVPWSRVLREKLTDPQLLKKFSAFYGTRRFITAFTRAPYLSVS
jgi:prolipoprotein diacylglyceryltransferase